MSQQQAPYTTPGSRYYALGVLTVVYSFNFIDRQLLAILQESIKADLSLSDSQLGLLTGFAFAVFYVVAGIPIARWADRSNRRNIVALAVFIWSFMTAISGFVQNYLQLLLAGHLACMGQERMFTDMDTWGYSFRLGSSRRWFEDDAEDALQWLVGHGLVDKAGQPRFRLRT